MKFFSFPSLLTALLLSSCASHFGNQKLADGWYEIKNPEKNIVKNRPMALASQFRSLKLDSVMSHGDGVIYTIVGQVGDSQKWANATEKAIGKQVGFIYEGKLMCAPRVNARIESGAFMINLPAGTPGNVAKAVFESLQSNVNSDK